MRRLGYIRNRAAPTIHGIRSATIGLIVPTVDHAIFAELIQAFSESVDQQGFSILLATHGYDLEREYRVLRKLLEHRVDGVAMVGTYHAPETTELLAQNDTPAITMWNFDEDTPLPCVGPKNIHGGRMIAEHVLAQGHRNIALIFPPTDENDRATDRLEGVNRPLFAGDPEVRILGYGKEELWKEISGRTACACRAHGFGSRGRISKQVGGDFIGFAEGWMQPG